MERDTENEFGRGDAQLPVLNFGVSPELARRLGTAQYQLPGGLHDHPKTGVSRTRCKSLLVPLSWATYGLPLHLVLVRRDQTSSAKPSAPGAFACLSFSAGVCLSIATPITPRLLARLVVPAMPADDVCVMRYSASSLFLACLGQSFLLVVI